MSVIYLGYRGSINAHRNDTVAAVQAYSVLVNHMLDDSLKGLRYGYFGCSKLLISRGLAHLGT